MNTTHLSKGRPGRVRRGWVRPRFALGAAALAVAGATWASLAAPARKMAPVPMSSSAPAASAGGRTTASAGAKKSLSAGVKTPSRSSSSLADLPRLIAAYGQKRRLPANPPPGAKGISKSGSGTGVNSTRLVSNGGSGFSLTETDLTPKTPSDEREPAVSPTGALVAFRSNGADTNGDGKIDSVNANSRYHIWVMNSDGTSQRQVTGLTPTLNGVVGGDIARSQFHPSWSPDGNQLIYADEDTDPTSNNPGGTQLFVVNPLAVGTPAQRTFGKGLKQAPAWSPSGLIIAFSSNADITATPAPAISTGRSLFSINPDGTGITRLTSGADDSNPAWGATTGNSNTLFFSSNLSTSGILPAGRRIWSVTPGSANRVQLTDPTQRANGKVTDSDDYPADSAAAFGERLAFQTNSLIDSSDTTPDVNTWSLAFGSTSSELGGNNFAQVLTNILSSPKNFQDSLLAAPQSEDKSGDGEGSFGRSVLGGGQQPSQLFFVSGRRFTTNPGNTLSNPNGGSEAGATDLNTSIAHDIWTSATQDTTPPSLIPQAAGNSLFPVVAPSSIAPFPAPRTYEDGLRAGGPLRFAVVLQDLQSGIDPNGVSISLFNADAPQFRTTASQGTDKDGKPVINNTVNEDIASDISAEDKPLVTASQSLTAYDDGPASAGGHEQQANAVAGDGNFYCEAIFTAPPTPGDYYIDVTANDRAGNRFTYDNVWGFSTQPFTRSSSGTSDLFVSDYTCGQNFPSALSTFAELRFGALAPVESYYLNNPAGPVATKDLAKPFPGGFGNSSEPVTFGAPAGSGSSIRTVFTTGSNAGVDVWRVLCRGPVPLTLMNSYLPTTVLQIDPTNPNPAPVATATPVAGATPSATPLPFSQLTRKVAVSRRAIIWASPYTNLVFTGTGTGSLTDSTTQNNLSTFLSGGGRLLVTGRNVASGLSVGGSSFLSGELGASLARFGVATRGATASPGLLNTNDKGGDPDTGFYGDFANLQFPRLDVPNNSNHENDAAGGAPNREFNNEVGFGNVIYGSGNFFVDTVNTNTTGGGKVTPIYTALNGGGTIGLTIERLRPNGISSRAVFLSFGMEAVNRRYRKPGDNDRDPRVALDVRRALASGILAYFKTTSFSGTIINNSTNQPVANFLVRLDGSDGSLFFARTDANGNYSFSGLLSSGPKATRFTVSPYIDPNTKTTSPPGFFGGDPTFVTLIGGDAGVSGLTLRVTPSVPGTVTGKVVRVVNNANAPINNLPVLIRSTTTSPLFPSGGIFSAITFTNADGSYTFSGVPALANMEVVFNPTAQDVPAGASLKYDPATQRLPQFLTRIVPRTGDRTRSGDIIVPTSGTFVVDDILNDTTADEGKPIVLSIDPNSGVTPTPTPITPTPTPGPGGTGPTPTPTPVPAGSSPTFAVGRSYAISLPYETSANAPSRNLFDRSDADATVSLTDAFNYTPTEGGNTLYTVSRFDVNTLTYIQLPEDAVLHRGEGYLLTVSALPQSGLALRLNTTVENPALLPLTQDPNKNQFSVVLSVNSSLSGNTLAGNNLIGFGFDPNQFSSVPWDTTTVDPNASSVTVTSGTRTYSLAQAVGNAPIDRLGTRISLLAPSLTTINAQTGAAGPATSLSAFGGYFVVAKKDGLRLTFKNPTTTGTAGTVIPANTSFAFTMPFATTADAAGTVPVSSAFTPGSLGYTVYAFNAAGQKGSNKKVTGGDFIDPTNGVLRRGVGYVVVTGSTPVTLNTSTPLVPFSGTTFDIPLGRNANFPGGAAASARNGFNLIGSPFDPFKTGNVSFANNVKVSATVNGKTYKLIPVKEAAARGIISNRLYTYDNVGNLTPVPLNDQFLRPYRGYFVQVFKDNVTMTLTASAR